MTALVLELKQGESMILNGAVIRFKTRTRLELSTHARFLFGRQIMSEEEATSPARRAYYAVQQAYIGTEDERPAALAAARQVVGTLHDAAQGDARAEWGALLARLGDDAGFEALKLARMMIRAEEYSRG